MTKNYWQAAVWRISLMCVLVCPALPCQAADDTARFGDSVEYQGQSIKLRKSYRDYDEFRNDTKNLAPGEAARAAQLVESTSLPKQFSDRRQMVAAVLKLKFPGYGLHAFGERAKPDGSVLALFGVEVPQAGRTRFLLLRNNGDSFSLVDDFVASDGADIADVTVRDGKLVYLSRQGLALVERPLSAR